jgi:putative transposase
VHVGAGHNGQPTSATIDSQTAKSAGAFQEARYDAGKETKIPKPHILVDTLGLLLMAVIHAADIQDSDGGPLVINLNLNK